MRQQCSECEGVGHHSDLSTCAQCDGIGLVSSTHEPVVHEDEVVNLQHVYVSVHRTPLGFDHIRGVFATETSAIEGSNEIDWTDEVSVYKVPFGEDFSLHKAEKVWGRPND